MVIRQVKPRMLIKITIRKSLVFIAKWGPSWSWSYGSWIHNYLCNQCLSPLKLWVRTPFMVRCLDTTLGYICQWLATGRWFSHGTPVSFITEANRHDITEIVLNVALSTITLYTKPLFDWKREKTYCYWQIKIRNSFHCKLLIDRKIRINQ